MICIEVLGTPAPKGSMRAALIGGKARLIPSGSRRNSRELYAWHKAIRSRIAEQLGTIGEPIFRDEPLSVHLLFRLVRPRSHYSKATGLLLPSAPRCHAVKPDVDKLARSTLDALTGELLDDDARVAVIQADKQWCDPGRQGVVITVERLETPARSGDLFAHAAAADR